MYSKIAHASLTITTKAHKNEYLSRLTSPGGNHGNEKHGGSIT